MVNFNIIKVFSYTDLLDSFEENLCMTEDQVESLFHAESYPIFFIQNNFPQMPEVESLLTKETGVERLDIIYIDFEE